MPLPDYFAEFFPLEFTPVATTPTAPAYDVALDGSPPARADLLLKEAYLSLFSTIYFDAEFFGAPPYTASWDVRLKWKASNTMGAPVFLEQVLALSINVTVVTITSNILGPIETIDTYTSDVQVNTISLGGVTLGPGDIDAYLGHGQIDEIAYFTVSVGHVHGVSTFNGNFITFQVWPSPYLLLLGSQNISQGFLELTLENNTGPGSIYDEVQAIEGGALPAFFATPITQSHTGDIYFATCEEVPVTSSPPDYSQTLWRALGSLSAKQALRTDAIDSSAQLLAPGALGFDKHSRLLRLAQIATSRSPDYGLSFSSIGGGPPATVGQVFCPVGGGAACNQGVAPSNNVTVNRSYNFTSWGSGIVAGTAPSDATRNVHARIFQLTGQSILLVTNCYDWGRISSADGAAGSWIDWAQALMWNSANFYFATPCLTPIGGGMGTCALKRGLNLDGEIEIYFKHNPYVAYGHDEPWINDAGAVLVGTLTKSQVGELMMIQDQKTGRLIIIDSTATKAFCSDAMGVAGSWGDW